MEELANWPWMTIASVVAVVMALLSLGQIAGRLSAIYDALLTQNHLIERRLPEGEIGLIRSELEDLDCR